MTFVADKLFAVVSAVACVLVIDAMMRAELVGLLQILWRHSPVWTAFERPLVVVGCLLVVRDFDDRVKAASKLLCWLCYTLVLTLDIEKSYRFWGVIRLIMSFIRRLL